MSIYHSSTNPHYAAIYREEARDHSPRYHYCRDCGSEVEWDEAFDGWYCPTCGDNKSDADVTDVEPDEEEKPGQTSEEPVPYRELWPNQYDKCPYCGARRVRVNTNYYEPSVRCDACKRVASATDWGLPLTDGRDAT